VTTASPSRKLSRETIRSEPLGSEIGIRIDDKPVNFHFAKRLLFKGHNPSVAYVFELLRASRHPHVSPDTAISHARKQKEPTWSTPSWKASITSAYSSTGSQDQVALYLVIRLIL
jgi:hypothetical protein